MNYPMLIEESGRKIAELTADIAQRRDEAAFLETQETVEILRAVGDNGKPLFSNETARETALAGRLICNEEYQTAKRAIRSAELARALELARLERLRGDFQLQLIDRRELADLRVGLAGVTS